MVVSGEARGGRDPELALVSAVVRITGRDALVGGVGFLIASDLVLTCAHVVSDALGLPREVVVAVGVEVSVDLPLVDGGADVRQQTAEVWRWVPVRADQTGDIAVLRLRAAIPGARPLPMADADSVWDHEARVVGFTDDNPDGTWYRGRFRGPTGRGWVQLSRADGQAPQIRRGFSGSPVWDDDLGAVVGLVVAAEPVREAQQAFVLRTRTALREVPELADVLRPAAPFRGLATFQEADTEVFFGRDEDATRVVTALRGDHSSVLLCGPSGCGKSSLALAGVVPRMRQAGYEVLVVDSGRVTSARAAVATELFEMARSGRYGLVRADSADHVECWLRELGLADTFHRITGRSARLLVVLDQAEALFNRSEPEIAEAVELLFPDGASLGLRILVTLRADFLNTALSHPHLGPALRLGVTLPLTPMTRDQLHQVITEPITRVPALEYDPGLDRRILDDAGGEPGILPLLGFVLARLWDKRAAGRLRMATYEDLGGVSGALRRHAEQAWRECVTPGDGAQGRRLLTGLVRVLPGGEAPMRRALTRDEAGEERWRLARALAERRLLVLYGGDGWPESAELAHEALITAWPTLAEQVRADADFLAGRAELHHDLERWRKAGRAPGLLPGALQLGAVGARLRGREADLTEEQREFLTRARQRQQARRIRARAGGVAVALALALIVGLATFLLQESKVSAQREADGRSRAIAVQSDESARTNLGQAALAALAAYEIAPTQEARSALMRRYLELKDATWTLTGAEGQIKAAAMSSDGGVTLVTTELGRATLFLRTADGTVRQEQLRLAANAINPVVSRDGRRIAYQRSGEGVVVWHDVTPSGELLVGPEYPLQGSLDQAVTGASGVNLKVMDFSPDARSLVGVSAASSTRPAQVWDLETGLLRMLPEEATGFEEVWFGPDENTLVAMHYPEGLGVGASAVVVDIGAGTTRELAAGINFYSGKMAVSRDGSVVVICQTKPGPNPGGEVHYRAIRVLDGQVVSHYRSDYFKCQEVAIDYKGERFAVPLSGGEWDLVDTAVDQDGTTRFLGPDYPETAAANLPLLGTARDPVVIIQSRTRVTGRPMDEYVPGNDADSAKLIGDGSTMVVRLGEGRTLRVMETEGAGRTIAEVNSDAETPPDAWQELQVNSAATLVADVSDHNRITVRALPSLHEVAEFTAAKPPVGKDGKPGLLGFQFHGDDRLVTVSDTRVEHWDARDGRRLSSPIDLRGLRLTTTEQPTYHVRPHSKPGRAWVTVAGEPHVHAVNLHTGQEDEDLRVRLGDDLGVAVPLKDPRYMAVRTVGGMVELWSVEPGRPSRRVAGPFGPMDSNRWVTGTTGRGGFFLAGKSSVRFLKADDPEYRETYVFADDQGFIDAGNGGKALLYSPVSGGRVDLLRLDPAIWKRHLCTVLGRDLTDNERDGLSSGLPTNICRS